MTARTPEPRHVAEALADLGRERVLEARAYLDAWRSLSYSQVPKHAIRHFLDKVPLESLSMAALDCWGGRHGSLFLVGNRGCGKSHAAVRWLHDRHKQGRLGLWVTCASWVGKTFDAQRAVLEVAGRTPALVLDDLGAGGSSDSSDAQKKLNGLLLERFESGLSSLVCFNGDHAGALSWLDPRLVDRLKVSGDIVDVSEPSRRTAELDEVSTPDCPCGGQPPCGHGRLWRNNHEIIELMGCELIPRATGEHADGPSVHKWRVGLTLVLGANNRRNGQAAELLGIPRGKVRERAAELAATDKTPSLRADLDAALLRMAAGMTGNASRLDGIKGLADAEHGQVLARMSMREHGVLEEKHGPVMSYEEARARHEAELAALALADMQRRATAARARADTQARSSAGKPLPKTEKTGEPWAHDPPRRGWVNGEPRVTMSAKPPCWTQGKDGRAKLKRCGFGVEPRPGGYVVVYAAQVKTERLPSIETAWEHAAKLAGLGA